MSPQSRTETLTDTLSHALDLARRHGADAADALLVRSSSQDVTIRLGEIEHLERSESADLGLRVLIGQRQAILSSSDLSPEALERMAETACAMARVVPEDPYCGLAQPEQLARNWQQPDVYEAAEPTTETLIDRAKEVEATARAPQGITNSQGGSASHGQAHVMLASTTGFAGDYKRSRHGLSVTVVAGEGTKMERDYAYTSGTHFADLRQPADVGAEAAQRTLARLNPGRPRTGKFPVLFDRRVSSGLLGSFASAINGSSIARGTSFLKDKMGQPVFADHITITDDPSRPHGTRSSAFDAEGLPRSKRNMVEHGVLQSWFLDLRTSRQLGLLSTGHASRGTSSPPSPSATNLYMHAGETSVAELIADIDYGVLVTGTMGMGVNLITGDYSQGANGFLIEQGRITAPVSEMTVAGHLSDIFATARPASDLKHERGIDAPSLLIPQLPIAGA